MNLDSLSINLGKLIFKFVRKQRFVGLEFGIPSDQITDGLTHREQSVLFVLNAMPEINVRDLAKHSGIERSWMSRVVTGLEEDGLVKSIPSTFDKRSKILNLTSKGRKKLIESEKVVKELFVKNLENLSSSEVSKFQEHLTTFADGINASVFDNNEDSHPVGFQLGRIGAELGLYADNVLNTDLTVNQIQTLLVLNEKKEQECSITEVDKLLPMDTSSVSRIIQLFVKRNWVNKVKSKTDKRSFSVKISNSGLKVIDKYFDNVIKKFNPALSKFSKEDLNEFLNLYKKVSSREGEKSFARKTLKEINESEYKVSISNFPKPSKTKTSHFSLKEDDDLKAVCVINFSGKKVSELKIVSTDLNLDEISDLYDLIKNKLG